MTWMAGEVAEAYAPEHSGRFIRITRQDGKVLYESGDTRDPYIAASKISHLPVLESKESFRREIQDRGRRLLIFSQPYSTPSGTKYLIETGASLSLIDRVLSSLRRILLLITPLILIAAVLGGHLLMTRPLRPLIELTEQAERIGTHKLGERLSVIATGDEMERLSLSLNRMISRLEDALDHNRRFSADVSHELRTPLTILKGELEQVVQAPQLPDSMRESVGSSLEEIDRMSKIVENLLTISRLDSGADAMVRQTVDLSQLALWTLDQMHLLAEEKQITMRSTHASPALILADPGRIKQVMVNLLDNAIKYTPDHGEINVSVVAAQHTAVLEVSDTGIGIPAESLSNVFQRFYRSDKARSRESGGTGLGLSIVQAICNAHGGSVGIQSVEGRGTTVRVELPLAPSPAGLETEVTSISSLSIVENDLRFASGAQRRVIEHDQVVK
ncbi:sensor histidine kinase [Edaphobacter bradus]|uniref:sensor histidine kinase n=1 Tax=Edaphobacter bradus TaxID=2259016 RepID=UPI0021E0613F|nr:HAMP domain-containing sensor histidine kinase [Edaphobacter bradus]